MEWIKIGGEVFPQPDEFRVDLETIGSFERNANGNIVGDLTGVKKKIVCGWAIMEDRHFKKLMAAAGEVFADAEYYDPEKGEIAAGKVMVTLQSGRIALKKGGEIYWGGVGCALTER